MSKVLFDPIRHGLVMAVAALVFGALWAAYMATHHEQLHGAFEAQEEQAQKAQMQHQMKGLNMDMMNMNHAHAAGTPDDHHATQSQNADAHAAGTPDDHHATQSQNRDAHAAGGQHSHSGSLAKDAMQRLLRGHIHFMGIGVLAAVLLLITAFTSLKPCWKKTLGWTLGLGALAYPPSWILMGFRTVELGPEAAEASVLWLFGPAVGLLLGSMGALLGVLLIETIKWNEKKIFQFLFKPGTSE